MSLLNVDLANCLVKSNEFRIKWVGSMLSNNYCEGYSALVALKFLNSLSYNKLLLSFRV